MYQGRGGRSVALENKHYANIYSSASQRVPEKAESCKSERNLLMFSYL